MVQNSFILYKILSGILRLIAILSRTYSNSTAVCVVAFLLVSVEVVLGIAKVKMYERLKQRNIELESKDALLESENRVAQQAADALRIAIHCNDHRP